MPVPRPSCAKPHRCSDRSLGLADTPAEQAGALAPALTRLLVAHSARIPR